MAEQSEFQNKLEYISRHKDEMLPTSTHAETVKAIHELVQEVEERHGGVWRFASSARYPQPNVVEAILQEAETKVFVWNNPEVSEHAKRVVFTMDNPGAFAALMPLVFALKRSSRCKSIEVIASNIAAEYIRENEGEDWFGFTQIRSTNITPGKSTPVLVDIFAKENEPTDVVFASLTSTNGPETLAFFGGKSTMGAKKLYFVMDGWGGANHVLANSKHMDKVDGIFCNDELAKRIVEKELPDFPKENIFASGTGQLDALELDHEEEHTHIGREKLGLNDDTECILYLGDISADYSSVVMPDIADPDICEKTFALVLEATINTAKSNKQKQFALLVRPHPRNSRTEEIWQMVANTTLPENLKIAHATNLECSMNEAAYASDAMISILSTENFKAPLRHRTAAFLGFSGKGMGGDGLARTYASEILDAVREMPGLAVVSSKEELADWLSKQRRAGIVSKSDKQTEAASDKIIKIAFAE